MNNQKLNPESNPRITTTTELYEHTEADDVIEACGAVMSFGGFYDLSIDIYVFCVKIWGGSKDYGMVFVH